MIIIYRAALSPQSCLLRAKNEWNIPTSGGDKDNNHNNLQKKVPAHCDNDNNHNILRKKVWADGDCDDYEMAMLNDDKSGSHSF